MDGDKWSENNMVKEERRSRSRSPIEKNNKSSRGRENNRNSRQSKGNRSRSPRGRRTRAPMNRRIYVANIPYDCKWTTIKDLFREKVGDVSYVELFEDEDGKFRGCGIVEFKDSASVQKAVDLLHRFEFRGRALVVKEDFDVDRDKTGKPIRNSSGGGGGGGSRGATNLDRDHRNDYGLGLTNNSTPQYNTYGLSPQFLDSLGIVGPLTNRIFVANLDYKVVTPQKLEEVFKLAGRVVKIDLKRDEEGNSKGHGTIEMGHPVEAVQAISMFNGQKFYNRTMSVRMDKKHINEVEDKKLPEGLQSVGKGLGANGLPLHLSNVSLDSTGGLNSLTPTGIAPVPPVGSGTLGIMSSQMTSGVGPVGATPTGIPGLAGIGMGLQERNFSSLSSSLGMGSIGQSLCVGTTGTGLTSSSLLPGGLGALSSNPNLGSSGLGTPLGGVPSLGSSLSLGGGSVGSSMTLGGYGDFDRSYDRPNDSFHSTRITDTIVVRNLPTSYTLQNLRDRFRDIGDVRYTEMKSRGTAVIRFMSERDAQRAFDHMRGARVDGRLLDVSFY